jgi:hypothetical protein
VTPTPAPTHFGQTLRKSKFGHRMTREMYAYPNRSPHQRFYREDIDESLWEGTARVYRERADRDCGEVPGEPRITE